LNAEIQHDQEKFLVYLSLGSNIDPKYNLPKAIQKIKSVLEVVSVSSIWQTPAVGFEGEDFLNAVVLIKTFLMPSVLKKEILRPIEALLGRTRTNEKYSPRTIDIDIILFQDILLDKELWSQAHLAVPLAELNPDFSRDQTGGPLIEVARILRNTSQIQKREDIIFDISATL
jgi:2-amino-4-hydroxy-6-hydroxymethyldihydropteridine diphosphokinase